MNTVVVVGNPKPASRTLEAATTVARALVDEDPIVVDIATFGAGVLEHGDPAVEAALGALASASVAIVASPTYKATYSGLLKIFLDRVPADGLAGVVAVPVMVGAGLTHALAPELLLKPVLVELGATCPTRGLYITEADLVAGQAVGAWLPRARAQIDSAAGAGAVVL